MKKNHKILCFLTIGILTFNSCNSILGPSTDAIIQNGLKYQDSAGRVSAQIIARSRDSLLNQKTSKYFYALTDTITNIALRKTVNALDSSVVRAVQIRDSFTNAETERRINILIDSVIKKTVRPALTQQQYEARKDIERIIYILGIICTFLIVCIAYFIQRIIKLKHSLQLITDEINDMDNNEALKNSIKNSAKEYNLFEIIQKEDAVRFKK